MSRILGLIVGASLGLVLGLAIGFNAMSGNVSSLESANEALSGENRELESRYSDLRADFEDLKRQEALFTRELKILTDRSPGRLLIINMTASQYTFNPNLIEADLGDIVVLRIWSTLDKEPNFEEHGFALNEWGINERLPKNTWTTIIFVADKTGEFNFWCSRVCGVDHNDMFGTLIIR